MERQRSASGGALALAVPPELVDAIALRVVELLAQQEASAQPPASPWLDVDGAASYLRCGSKQRVYDLVHAGRLKPARDGRRLLFRREDLDEYVSGAPTRAAA